MIFLDTNVVSETFRPRPDTNVSTWFARHERLLVVSSVVLAEISFGIERVRPAERSSRLQAMFERWLGQFSTRIFAFDVETAKTYGRVMGAASLSGRGLATADGMIAALAVHYKSPLATRNVKDFAAIGVELIDPWSPSA